VLHGPNLNLLGDRPIEHYGTLTLADLERLIAEQADRLGWDCLCHQTNHEGEYIELVHRYRHESALLVNPGAWTHYSWAVHDALELVKCPIAEVHLSDVSKREEWRRVSVVSSVAAFTISGKGAEGYLEAVSRLIDLVHARAAGE
jgi:3-dehydroquinate dehydratase-2